MMAHHSQTLPSLSFVVPAHNEEHEIEGCLRSLRHAAIACECVHEIIVVNDSSSDDTERIAREFADRVVNVELRNIGAVRNAGAACATNSVLIFMDADTRMPSGTLEQIVSSVKKGAYGGGASVRFDRKLDPIRHVLAYTFIAIWQNTLGYAAGCLVYVRRDLFEAFGGFNEQYFAAEEMYLSREIKRRGKFRIVRRPVITSGRKMRSYGLIEIIVIAFNALLRGPRSWRSKERLGILYDARREVA